MNKITKHGLAYYLKDYKQITCPECNSDRILLEIAETYLLHVEIKGRCCECECEFIHSRHEIELK